MMSLLAAFRSFGSVVSISLGGFVLVRYGWGVLGGVGFLFSIIGFLALYFYAIEPELR
jgi:predicted MFS family arabinose efflux permease